MARKKTTIKKEEPKVELSRDEKFRENVLTILREHSDLIKGVLDDYLVTDGAELEIAQALTNLVIAVKTIEFEEEEKQELTAEQVIDLAKEFYESDEIESSDLLEFLVDDEIVDYVRKPGYVFVKLNTMEQQNKFRQFAETELWPHLNDQRQNILI
jgi:hypothetical protein